MDKQDRQSPRRVDELDQRYRFSRRFAEIMGIATDSRDTANRALVLADQTIADVRRLTEDGEKLQASIKINADKIEAEVKRATESEGELSSRIKQTAEQIEMIVNDSTTTNGELSSRIAQNAESITAEVTRAKGAEGVLSSRITQTADAITAEVSRAEGVESSLSSRITQTAESITSEVTRSKKVEGELSDRIDAEGNRASAAEEKLSSRITQTAESITAEVTRATNAENALSGRISVEAGRVSLLVDDSGKVKGSVIVEAINGQSAAHISADLIEMTGQTTFLTPDDVGANGKTVIHGGRIDTNSLYIAADHIGGKLVVGDIFAATMPADGGAASVQIGGFTVTKSGLVHDRITIGTSGIGLGSSVADMEGENVHHTTWISPLGKLISYQPIFYEMTVKGTTRFTGADGQIVQFAIPVQASKLSVNGVDFSSLVARVEALEDGGGESHTHSYALDESTVTADCTHNGTGVYRCSCGDSWTDVIYAYGHDYGTPYEDANQSSGWSQRCRDCGDIAEADCPHSSLTLTVTKEATCTDGGERHEVCDACGDSWFHSYIDPNGHDWEYYPDSSVSSGWSRVCNRCGEIEEDQPHG